MSATRTSAATISTGPSINVHGTIEICLRAHQECMEALQYCLQKGGDHADPHHLKVMQTNAEVTLTIARLMMLQSPYQHMLAELTAQVCLDCAKACESMQDEALMDCVRANRECAEMCRRLVLN